MNLTAKSTYYRYWNDLISSEKSNRCRWPRPLVSFACGVQPALGMPVQAPAEACKAMVQMLMIAFRK